MKYLFTLLLTASMSFLFAQAPQEMSYQGIVRAANGDPVTSQTIGVQISILSGSATGTVVYAETHSESTNVNGLLTLSIGTGTIVSGTFSSIDWGANTYYIKSEVDPDGGTTYEITGTSQLLSVPYALYAADSGATGDDLGNHTASDDLILGSNAISDINTEVGTAGQVLSSTGNGVDWVDATITPKFVDGDTATDAVFATGNVGIGTADPEGVLDVTSTNSGLILPRVANTAAVSTPVNGMLIYDISTTCVKAYENNTWTGCLFTPLSPSDTILAQIGLEGDNPDSENSVVTVAELEMIIPLLIGLDSANETAYQDYIDIYPDLFSMPATQQEVQDMVDALNGAPNPNLTAANVTYQGTSVIDATGIGYNGEAVPTASTITVELTNTSTSLQVYSLIATDITTGLSYRATGTIAGSASGAAVVLSPNGAVMPDFSSGVITMALMGTSSTLNLVPRIDVKSIATSDPDWAYNDVTYGTQTWMDRNLGARRVATALNDVYSYGNHYQWGRPADGHEISVWNGTTHTSGRGFYDATALGALATTDVPGHNNFILSSVAPFDWRSDNNNNRWATASQGPCPAGYHVPTDAEWITADAYNNGAATSGGATVGWDNRAEAFASDLKLPSAGNRTRLTGLLLHLGVNGYCWSSTTNNTSAHHLFFIGSVANTTSISRAYGLPVRCLKN